MGEIEKIIKDYHGFVSENLTSPAKLAFEAIMKSVDLAQTISNSFGDVRKVDLPMLYAAVRLLEEALIGLVDEEDGQKSLESAAILAIEVTDCKCIVVLKGDI